MQRRPEPELMNDRHQAEAYARADFEEPHRFFVERCITFLEEQALEPATVLDLGCGPADITVRLAHALPRANLMAVEAATAMIDLAADRIASEGLDGRIGLMQAHIPDQDLATGDFDLVISNSLLHHLTDPIDLWHTVKTLGRPGGAVFVMDLRRPAGREEAQALVDRYAQGEPAVLRHDFFHSLCAAYRPDEVATQLGEAGLLGALRIEVPTDRHLIVSGRLPH